MVDLLENNKSSTNLPPLPQKRYFAIGEVSKLCDVKPHVLRYWEQEFPQLTPTKRRGNRRYYQRKDVLLIRQIKNLLYNQGFTIEGAKSQLSQNDNNNEAALFGTKEFLKGVVSNLEQALSDIDGYAE